MARESIQTGRGFLGCLLGGLACLAGRPRRRRRVPGRFRLISGPVTLGPGWAWSDPEGLPCRRDQTRFDDSDPVLIPAISDSVARTGAGA